MLKVLDHLVLRHLDIPRLASIAVLFELLLQLLVILFFDLFDFLLHDRELGIADFLLCWLLKVGLCLGLL